MKIFISGISDFIGAAIADALREDGHEIVAAAAGDLADPNLLLRGMSGAACVVHNAMFPISTLERFVDGRVHAAETENLLNAFKHSDATRCVVISSADVTLGFRDRVHWNERKDIGAESDFVFGQGTKLAEDLALAASTNSHSVIALRPAWLWGSHTSPNVRHVKDELLHARKLQLVGDGKTLFSSLYIDNFMDAVKCAIRAPNQRGEHAVTGRAYYIADQEILDAREFFGALAKALGGGQLSQMPMALARIGAFLSLISISTEEVARRGQSTLFDMNDAERLLEWKPRVSFEDALRALSVVREQPTK